MSAARIPVEWLQLPEVVEALIDAVWTHPHERIAQVIDNALRFYDPDVAIFYASSTELVKALKAYAAPKGKT